MPDSITSRFAIPQSGPNRLTWLYITALSAVALLSLAGQAVVQLYFERQMSDSNVINVAGRQRMLSQRIAKSVLALRAAATSQQQAGRRQELRETLALWERCHRGLQQGDGELRLPASNSTEIKQMFADLEPSFKGLYLPAQRLCSRVASGGDSGSQDLADVNQVLDYESRFLAGMDTIVSQYALEASGHVERVKRIEQVLLAITLLVLLLEGLFIFRPAVRGIRELLAALHAAGAKLLAAKEAAEQANQAKTRFLATTSHELRTPLHAILGIAEQLQKTPLQASQQDGLCVLQGAANTLTELVNDLLDLARIESGKLDLRLEAVDLKTLVDQAVSQVRPVAEGKGLRVDVHLSVDLPKVIVTDGLRLTQVLLNLLGNAVKFTDQGSVTLSVARLPDDLGNARLTFKVSDTGIGIPPAEQERIFESFSQVDTSWNRTRGGAGLGLSVSRQLAELLGGTIHVTSAEDCGSQFTLTISCNIAGTEKNSDDASGKTEHRAMVSVSPVRPLILVVDDAPANCYLAVSILHDAGFDVETATSGQEALKLIGSMSFDAALLDVHMPGMDGLELASAMQKVQMEHLRPRMPIVALTADVLPETTNRLLQHSIDKVLHKPANAELILTAVSEVLKTGEKVAGTLRVPSAAVRLPSTAATGRRNSALQRLRGNEALLAELSEIFHRESLLQQSTVEDALQRGDLSTLRQAVHRLRGQALMFDADALCGLLDKIEAHALVGELQPCVAYWSEAVPKLIVLCDELCQRA